MNDPASLPANRTANTMGVVALARHIQEDMRRDLSETLDLIERLRALRVDIDANAAAADRGY